jgi:hypothetical protein
LNKCIASSKFIVSSLYCFGIVAKAGFSSSSFVQIIIIAQNLQNLAKTGLQVFGHFHNSLSLFTSDLSISSLFQSSFSKSPQKFFIQGFHFCFHSAILSKSSSIFEVNFKSEIFSKCATKKSTTINATSVGTIFLHSFVAYHLA